MSKPKNPHDQGSPEWLLFSNIESKLLEAQAFAAEAERYTVKANEARALADRFRDALESLTAPA